VLTLIHRLFDWAKDAPNDIAQTYKDNNGQRHSITAYEYALQTWAVGQFLKDAGIGKGDVSLILSYNCPAWATADLAAGLAGAMSAGLYPNSSFQDIQHIFNLTQGKVLFLQNKSYWQKATNLGVTPLPASLQKIVTFDNDTSFDKRAIGWRDIIEKYRPQFNLQQARAQLDKLDPHAAAFIIFTSGTTGQPKGSMLSHDNMVFSVDRVKDAWKLTDEKASTFSFLPLCHIAEKMQNLCACLTYRYRADFCSSFDKMPQELLEVRPTLLLAVPRLWEKMMEGVNKKISESKGIKKNLALWALSTGNEYVRTANPSAILKIKYNLAKKLVLNKIRQAIGLDRTTRAASGAAALHPSVVYWFRALGINILEVYGQTESTGVICITPDDMDCAGTVGPPFPGIHVELAADGEILTSGRSIFKGYLNNPSATAEVIRNGVLHTGDLGKQDEKGRIKIIGRKKEIMKTSGGKMIAPVPIEERMKECGMLSQACMVGEGRKFFSMVVTLAEGLQADSDLRKKLDAHKEEVNRQLASFEQIKYVAILPRDFTIEHGELTPTMKVKRAMVERNFSKEIDAIYAGQ
jgi:long-chain acyl-CoA synthetase